MCARLSASKILSRFVNVARRTHNSGFDTNMMDDSADFGGDGDKSCKDSKRSTTTTKMEEGEEHSQDSSVVCLSDNEIEQLLYLFIFL